MSPGQIFDFFFGNQIIYLGYKLFLLYAFFFFFMSKLRALVVSVSSILAMEAFRYLFFFFFAMFYTGEIYGLFFSDFVVLTGLKSLAIFMVLWLHLCFQKKAYSAQT